MTTPTQGIGFSQVPGDVCGHCRKTCTSTVQLNDSVICGLMQVVMTFLTKVIYIIRVSCISQITLLTMNNCYSRVK